MNIKPCHYTGNLTSFKCHPPLTGLNPFGVLSDEFSAHFRHYLGNQFMNIGFQLVKHDLSHSLIERNPKVLDRRLISP